MKYLFLFLLIWGASSASYAQTDEVFTMVEEMPVFPGCEKEKGKTKIVNCTNNKIYAHITSRSYKVKLREGEQPGSYYVSFMINEEGEVGNVKMMRSSMSDRLDSVAIKIVKSLPTFFPGTQKGKPVEVQLNVPVKFR